METVQKNSAVRGEGLVSARLLAALVAAAANPRQDRLLGLRDLIH